MWRGTRQWHASGGAERRHASSLFGLLRQSKAALVAGTPAASAANLDRAEAAAVRAPPRRQWSLSVWRSIAGSLNALLAEKVNGEHQGVQQAAWTWPERVITGLTRQRGGSADGTRAAAAPQAHGTSGSKAAVLVPFERSFARTFVATPSQRRREHGPAPRRQRSGHRLAARARAQGPAWAQAVRLYRAVSEAGVSTSRTAVRQLFGSVPDWVFAINDHVRVGPRDGDRESPKRRDASFSTLRWLVAEAAEGTVAWQRGDVAGRWQEALQLLGGAAGVWPWPQSIVSQGAVPPAVHCELPATITAESPERRTQLMALTALVHAARHAARDGNWTEALRIFDSGRGFFDLHAPTQDASPGNLAREQELRLGMCAVVALAVGFCRGTVGGETVSRLVEGSGSVLPHLTLQEIAAVRGEPPRSATTNAAREYVCARLALQPAISAWNCVTLRPDTADGAHGAIARTEQSLPRITSTTHALYAAAVDANEQRLGELRLAVMAADALRARRLSAEGASVVKHALQPHFGVPAMGDCVEPHEARYARDALLQHEATHAARVGVLEKVLARCTPGSGVTSEMIDAAMTTTTSGAPAVDQRSRDRWPAVPQCLACAA
jgi:hypothetical protein